MFSQNKHGTQRANVHTRAICFSSAVSADIANINTWHSARPKHPNQTDQRYVAGDSSRHFLFRCQDGSSGQERPPPNTADIYPKLERHWNASVTEWNAGTNSLCRQQAKGPVVSLLLTSQISLETKSETVYKIWSCGTAALRLIRFSGTLENLHRPSRRWRAQTNAPQ